MWNSYILFLISVFQFFISLSAQNTNYTYQFSRWELSHYTPSLEKKIGIWPQKSSIENKLSYEGYKKLGFSKIWTAEEDAPHWGHFAKKLEIFDEPTEFIFQVHKDNYKGIIEGPKYSDIKYYYIDEPFENEYLESDTTGDGFTVDELSYFIEQMPQSSSLIICTYSGEVDIIRKYNEIFNKYKSRTFLAPMNYNENLTYWQKCSKEFYPGVPIKLIWMNALRVSTFNQQNLKGAFLLSDEIWIYAIDASNFTIYEILYKAWLTGWLKERIEDQYLYTYKWDGQGIPIPFNVNNESWILISKVKQDTRKASRSKYKFNSMEINNYNE